MFTSKEVFIETMRWRKNNFRWVRRFALFPIRINSEYRWWEIVYIEQRRNWLDCWENYKFITKEEYMKFKQED